MEVLSTQLDSINGLQPAIQSSILLPKKLDPNTVTLLNQRLQDEYTAYYFYMNAANWCIDKGYKKAAAFFNFEAASELEHAKLLQSFMISWNVIPFIPPVKLIPAFTNLIDIINKAYEMEYNLLIAYNNDSLEIFTVDLVTFDFLQQFRQFQNKSVVEYSDLLNAAQLIDVSSKLEVLYFENKYFKI
ncbi:MAG TPA: ferritin-like domain-containing protein [Candidatus Absconditabacterales bacterium]|nr:ferritin-like domain-containing protein [Candidatus Absconditabacterales bacterium]